MGILNATPDSFYDGGQFFDPALAIKQGIQLYQQGADILDIGGESTRPGSDPVSEEEELRRILPIIQTIKSQIPIPISIDTMKPRVAASALEAGATLINDVTGFINPLMREIASSSHSDICVMHMQGTPKTMQAAPHYEEGIIPHLIQWFESRVNLLIKDGVKEQKIIIDPGIGFGKTIADNLEIIDNLHRFKELGFPVLLGLSRKTFMAKILAKPYAELLPATLAMNTLAIIKGVDIIRVHDITEHRDVINVLDKMPKRV